MYKCNHYFFAPININQIAIIFPDMFIATCICQTDSDINNEAAEIGIHVDAVN